MVFIMEPRPAYGDVKGSDIFSGEVIILELFFLPSIRGSNYFKFSFLVERGLLKNIMKTRLFKYTENFTTRK